MNLLKKFSLGSFMILFLFSMNAYTQNMGSGSISGMVMSEADSLPIAKAKVFAFKFQNMMMPKKYHAETGVNGAYKIDNLPDGQYLVQVQVDSFVSEFYKNAYNPALAIPIDVGNGAAVAYIDFYLKLGGTISGFVTELTGAGIPNVCISATPYNMFSHPAWMDSLAVWGSALTDENGYYKISTLDSGEYRVTAKIRMHAFPFLQVKFYDNKENYSDADPVLVDNRKEVAGIDFQFDFKLPTGGIAGTITDANGDPLEGIYVFAWTHSKEDTYSRRFKGFGNPIRTDAYGKYEIKHLIPGDYVVSATRMEWWNFQTIYYDGVSKYQDATPVPVTDTMTPDIDFVFDQAVHLGSISGKVTSDEDGKPIPNAFVEAMCVRSHLEHEHTIHRPSMYAWTDANGDYKIDMLQSGKYIVLVHKNGYTEFYNDTQDIDKVTHVEVQAGKETSGINFGIPRVADAGSKVTGVVTNDFTGDPIEGAIVTLFPLMDAPYGNAFKGKFTLFDFYATVTDKQGKYMIAGIPAGKYIAVCWAQKFIVKFYDDKFCPWRADQLELDGTTDKADINFALTPGWGFQFQEPANDLASGMISGQVTDNEGRYVAGAYVSVIDENYQVQATEMTGPDGNYTLGGIPAGDYYIKVDRMPYSTAYYGNTTELSKATTVTVGDVGTFSVTSVDVELIPMSATSVEEENNVSNVPAEFELMQNYPNPFNPTTTIRYILPKASRVTLKIYNLRGELVKTLVDGYQSAQNHQVTWNGDNEAGEKVAAGIYLYRLKTENYQQTKRLVFLK